MLLLIGYFPIWLAECQETNQRDRKSPKLHPTKEINYGSRASASDHSKEATELMIFYNSLGCKRRSLCHRYIGGDSESLGANLIDDIFRTKEYLECLIEFGDANTKIQI